jgi:DNA-binding XRE family transcriptional regulator
LASMCLSTYAVVMSGITAIADLEHPGDSIRERRIELGWTQAELAKRTGIPQADISRLENGHLDARWSTVHRLSIALSGEHRPRRSLANAGRRAAPARGGKLWTPEGQTARVEQ